MIKQKFKPIRNTETNIKLKIAKYKLAIARQSIGYEKLIL
jgi:hypothetical protein